MLFEYTYIVMISSPRLIDACIKIPHDRTPTPTPPTRTRTRSQIRDQTNPSLDPTYSRSLKRLTAFLARKAMNSRPKTQNIADKKWRLSLAGIGLSAVSFWLLYQYPAPLPLGDVGIASLDDAVFWSNEYAIPKNRLVDKLDLHTGQLQRVAFGTIQSLGSANSRNERFVFVNGVHIYDASSGQRLWSNQFVDQESLLVGEDFVLSVGEENVSISDFSTGFKRPARMQVTIPGLFKPFRELGPAIQAIEGTNRFVCLVNTKAGLNVRVYEIDHDKLREVATWPCYGLPIVQHAGQLLTLAIDKVEVRSLPDCQLIKTHALPPSLRDWSEIEVSGDLFRFFNPNLRRTSFGSLNDFQLIPELDLATELAVGDKPGDTRLHVLANAKDRQVSRLAVYDSRERRIIYDSQPMRHLSKVTVWDRKLVQVHADFGLTVEVIDLATGKLVGRYQPYLWRVWAIALVAASSVGWYMLWSTLDTAWHGWMLPSHAFVLALFLPPLLGTLSPHIRSPLSEPALMTVVAAVFGLTIHLCYHAIYGKLAWPLRFGCVAMWLAGLMAIARWQNMWMWEAFGQSAIGFICLAILLLGALKASRPRIVHVSRHNARAVEQTPELTPALAVHCCTSSFLSAAWRSCSRLLGQIGSRVMAT